MTVLHPRSVWGRGGGSGTQPLARHAAVLRCSHNKGVVSINVDQPLHVETKLGGWINPNRPERVVE